MRLTDLPTMARNALPGHLKLQIPLATELDILEELFSVGVGLSAAAAVGWTLSHTDRPIISGTIETVEQASDLGLKILKELSENMSDMTSDQIAAGAEVLKVLSPLGLLKG